jgi:hypothetical protein
MLRAAALPRRDARDASHRIAGIALPHADVVAQEEHDAPLHRRQLQFVHGGLGGAGLGSAGLGPGFGSALLPLANQQQQAAPTTVVVINQQQVIPVAVVRALSPSVFAAQR